MSDDDLERAIQASLKDCKRLQEDSKVDSYTSQEKAFFSSRQLNVLPKGESIDEDYLLAKRLEEEDLAQLRSSKVRKSNDVVLQQDSDYLMALKLQELESKSSPNPSSGVRIFPNIVPSVKENNQTMKKVNSSIGSMLGISLPKIINFPKCYLCNRNLPTSFFLPDPILLPDETGYCPEHQFSCKLCCSCNLREPLPSSGKEGFTELPDGRHLCSNCISTSLFDSNEAIPLYKEIIHFFQFQLQLAIPSGMNDIPVLLVDNTSLNEQRQSTNYSHEFDDSCCTGLSINRGLTLSSISEVKQITPGGFSFNFSQKSFIQSPPKIVKLSVIREVSAVLVLCGLPKVMTSSILAHEAMHVWCKLTTAMPIGLPKQVEEGLCQLISKLYLEYLDSRESSTSSSSSRHSDTSITTHSKSVTDRPSTNTSITTTRGDTSWDNRFRTFCQFQIENDTSAVYGDGYREARIAYDHLGILVLLDHIREFKAFPHVT